MNMLLTVTKKFYFNDKLYAVGDKLLVFKLDSETYKIIKHNDHNVFLTRISIKFLKQHTNE